MYRAIGLDQLRWIGSTGPFDLNSALTTDQGQRLDSFAQNLHTSRDMAAAQLIEEALRRLDFPAIKCRDPPVGRQACVVPSGLAVWELLMVAQDYQLDSEATAKHLCLPLDAVEQALRYAQAYPQQLNAALEENRATTPAMMRATLPPSTVFGLG